MKKKNKKINMKRILIVLVVIAVIVAIPIGVKATIAPPTAEAPIVTAERFAISPNPKDAPRTPYIGPPIIVPKIVAETLSNPDISFGFLTPLISYLNPSRFS